MKWRGYEMDHNTWEPMDNLLTGEVQAEARSVRTAALQRDHVGVAKHVLLTLQAALLEERGRDTSGRNEAL